LNDKVTEKLSDKELVILYIDNECGSKANSIFKSEMKIRGIKIPKQEKRNG